MSAEHMDMQYYIDLGMTEDEAKKEVSAWDNSLVLGSVEYFIALGMPESEARLSATEWKEHEQVKPSFFTKLDDQMDEETAGRLSVLWNHQVPTDDVDKFRKHNWEGSLVERARRDLNEPYVNGEITADEFYEKLAQQIEQIQTIVKGKE